MDWVHIRKTTPLMEIAAEEKGQGGEVTIIREETSGSSTRDTLTVEKGSNGASAVRKDLLGRSAL